MVRRSANPEGYKHSRSEKVKRARDAMREVMIRFSKLDIYTRQLYTEATALDNPIFRDYIWRKIIEYILKRQQRPPKITPFPDPTPVIPPVPSPAPTPTPNPDIHPYPWPYPGWDPTPKKSIRPGPPSYTHDHLPREIPNPSRDGPKPVLPPDEKNPIDDNRELVPTPVYIVVEIDPSGLTGTAYEVYLEAKSAYRQAKRWISSHKKEVVIIVMVGVLIFFTYTVFIGGTAIGTGSYVLIDESYQPMLPLLLPYIGNRPIELYTGPNI